MSIKRAPRNVIIVYADDLASVIWAVMEPIRLRRRIWIGFVPMALGLQMRILHLQSARRPATAFSPDAIRSEMTGSYPAR